MLAIPRNLILAGYVLDMVTRSSILYDLYLFFSQPVKLVHQLIDLPVGGLDLALEQCLLMAGSSEMDDSG
jgi:hypothetical protein